MTNSLDNNDIDSYDPPHCKIKLQQRERVCNKNNTDYNPSSCVDLKMETEDFCHGSAVLMSKSVGSGYCRGGIDGKQKLNGRYKKNLTWEHCATECLVDQNCNGYTWKTKDSACYLYGKNIDKAMDDWIVDVSDYGWTALPESNHHIINSYSRKDLSPHNKTHCWKIRDIIDCSTIEFTSIYSGGDCDSFAPGQENHGWCDDDVDEKHRMCTAKQSCPDQCDYISCFNLKNNILDITGSISQYVNDNIISMNNMIMKKFHVVVMMMMNLIK